MYQYADQKIVQWLEKNLYHPRSDKHGEAICDFFLKDLLYQSDLLRKEAQQGKVVYSIDYKLGKGALSWVVDLVLGPPITKPLSTVRDGDIAMGKLQDIWLAIDAKSVMTEHGKARRNRQRDLDAFASIVKHYYPHSVVGGIVTVNISEKFKSPLRPNITEHRNIRRLVDETIQIFREIPRAQTKEGDKGIEAICVIVVNHSNIRGEHTILIKDSPAPQKKDMVNYQEFLRMIKDALEHRFLINH